jgi:hypothetical protein
VRFVSRLLAVATCLLVLPSVTACVDQPNIISGVPDQPLQDTLLRQTKSNPTLRALYDAGYKPIKLTQNKDTSTTELTFGPCDLSQKATINDCAGDGYSLDKPRVAFATEGVPTTKDEDFKLTDRYAVISRRSTDGSPNRHTICRPNRSSDLVLDSEDRVLYLGAIVKQFLNKEGVVSPGSREIDLTRFSSQATRAGETPIKKIWKCT